jgi:SAM-dependent methyltransferase
MVEHFKYPEYFARFYDLIYHQIRDGVDNDFFLSKITAAKGRVLELGVGTGRFFADGISRGVDLYGIDISESMLNVLRGKLPDTMHYRIRQGDAVTMQWEFKFDLIIAPFRVLSHVLEVRDQRALLNNVYDHLNPGGAFIFDLFVPNPQLLANGIENLTDYSGEYEPGKSIKRIVWSKPDLVNQILNITMKFIWDEGEEIIEKEWNMKLRFYFRYELEHLVSSSKLHLESIYGDYKEGQLCPDSKDFIVHCLK